jgi:hypothetical protein
MSSVWPDLLRDLDGYPLAITIAASLLYGGSSLQTVLRQWRNRRTAALKVPGHRRRRPRPAEQRGFFARPFL